MRLTQIPEDVFEALACGRISKTQFAVLTQMHRWADYQTGKIRAFCAERVLRALNIEVTGANKRAMQRTLRALRDAGWYHDDYKLGSKRPFNAFLSNYRPGRAATGTTAEDNQENLSNRRQNADDVADLDGEEIVLNPREIKPCASGQASDVADGDGEGVADKSLNNHIKDQTGTRPSGSEPTDKIKDENVKAGCLSPDDALELTSFIWETCHFSRTRVWAAKWLQNYPLDELRYAIIVWLYQQYGGDAPRNADALKIFFEEGIETVIYTERKRRKDGLATYPPKEWAEFLSDRAACAGEDSEPNRATEALQQ